jgi:hypothetical protein
MSMRFIATFKKTCSFNDWLELIDKLKPHLEKHGIRMIFAAESEDRQSIYDIAEAKTMEGVEAFLSDPDVRKMRIDAGVDIDSHQVISGIGDFHSF